MNWFLPSHLCALSEVPAPLDQIKEVGPVSIHQCDIKDSTFQPFRRLLTVSPRPIIVILVVTPDILVPTGTSPKVPKEMKEATGRTGQGTNACKQQRGCTQ